MDKCFYKQNHLNALYPFSNAFKLMFPLDVSSKNWIGPRFEVYTYSYILKSLKAFILYIRVTR